MTRIDVFFDFPQACVTRTFVDGAEVKTCIAADDVEGWAVSRPPGEQVQVLRGQVRFERITLRDERVSINVAGVQTSRLDWVLPLNCTWPD